MVGQMGSLLKGVIPKEFYHFVELLDALTSERLTVDLTAPLAVGIEEDRIGGLRKDFEIGFDEFSVSHNLNLPFFFVPLL
jgi:hypothetical protein